jgi:hypothetical protein
MGREKLSARRAAARGALVKALWDAHGVRRLPSNAQLRRAIDGCDRGDVWWVCEMNPTAPIYLLPTREWIRALAKYIEGLGVRSVLEVAAGDGFLSRCLAAQAPKLKVIATDDGSWEKAKARMSARERRAYAHLDVPGLVLGSNVKRLSAQRAVQRYRPDLVLISWAPPGTLVQRVIRGPCKYVLDFGTEGNECGGGPPLWRLAQELVEGPLEKLAWCRLDERSTEPKHTRVTLYHGARHRASRVKTS